LKSEAGQRTLADRCPTQNPPTRAEFERLKEECERLHAYIEVLKEQMSVYAKDARIQFQRIAEIQAILDEEHKQPIRRADGPVSTPLSKRRV